MKITVYRPNQIGGCITKIESNSGTKIIIDAGSNLPGNKDGKEVDINELTTGCAGVFITHYHGDHIGEFEKVNAPIYMGRDAKRIFLTIQQTLKFEELAETSEILGVVKRLECGHAEDLSEAHCLNHTLYHYPLSEMSENCINMLESSFDNEGCKEFIKEITSDESWFVKYESPGKQMDEVFESLLKSGYGSLTDAQKAMFKRELKYTLRKCGRCEDFSWSDAAYLMEDELCMHCKER
jgi:hypothetical protein